MILTLQRRLREVGRIRLGEKRVSQNGKTYPAKLGVFRLTSRNGAALKHAAECYGGTVQPWTDAPTDDEQFELVTETNRIRVTLPPGDFGFSQWLELWSGGGCQRRCDGVTEQITEGPCLCDAEDGERQCAPTSRLNVILRDLPTLGVWRLETKSYNAAQELAGSVAILEQALQRGALVPAFLRIEHREKKVPGEPTRKFIVPTLDIGTSTFGALMADQQIGEPLAPQADTGTELEASQADMPALPASPPDVPGRTWQPVDHNKLPPGPSPSIADQIAAVDELQAPSKRSNAQVPIPNIDLPMPDATPEPEPEPERDTGTWNITEAQRKRLFAECADAQIDDTLRHQLTAFVTSEVTESSNDIDRDTYKALIAVVSAIGSDVVDVADAHSHNGITLRTGAAVDEIPDTLGQMVRDSRNRWAKRSDVDSSADVGDAGDTPPHAGVSPAQPETTS